MTWPGTEVDTFIVGLPLLDVMPRVLRFRSSHRGDRVAPSPWNGDTQRHSGEQILELGPVADDLPHEPAFRLNLQIEAPHLSKGAAHEVITVATAAEGQGHLSVEYCHEVADDAVVRDGDSGRRIHLEPVQLRVVANRIKRHQGLITGSMRRVPRAQTTLRITTIVVRPVSQRLLQQYRARARSANPAALRAGRGGAASQMTAP